MIFDPIGAEYSGIGIFRVPSDFGEESGQSILD